MTTPNVGSESIDEVIAGNLRRLRDAAKLSRHELAARLVALTGTSWSRWRIVDLEGSRNPGRSPSAIKWSELVGLCLALDTTIFELVLPTDSTRVEIQSHSRQIVTDPPAGVASQLHTGIAIDSDELSRLLFRIPSDHLTPEVLAQASEHATRIYTAEHLEENYRFLMESAEAFRRKLDALGDGRTTTEGA